MIKIQIIKCQSQILWYSSRIGEVFLAYRDFGDSYLVRACGAYSNIIYKNDCITLTNEGETNDKQHE